MKKKSALKTTLITIAIVILIPCLFIGGVLGYRWTQDYIFYPRTIQDIIDKFDNMDEEKASRRGYCNYERYGGNGFSYMKPVRSRYKNRSIAKNRISIVFQEGIEEKKMEELAKRYKSEIVDYSSGSSFFGIELKKHHTLKELEAVVEEIRNYPDVTEAYPYYSSDSSHYSSNGFIK